MAQTNKEWGLYYAKEISDASGDSDTIFSVAQKIRSHTYSDGSQIKPNDISEIEKYIVEELEKHTLPGKTKLPDGRFLVTLSDNTTRAIMDLAKALRGK